MYKQKYLKYKQKYLQLKGGAPPDNNHCINPIYGVNNTTFVRNTDCNIGQPGYVVDTLDNFITTHNLQSNVRMIGGERCFVGYNGDRGSNNTINPFTTRQLYMPRMNDFFINRNPAAIGYNPLPPINWTNRNGFGQEPSIGLNLINDASVALMYGNMNTQRNGENMIALFKIYIKIADTNIVLISNNCDWSQITCDQTVNTTYHLIGHQDNTNGEINVLDKGRDCVVRIETTLYNLDEIEVPNSTIQII